MTMQNPKKITTSTPKSIPFEIIEDILLKLPAKSLLRFRCLSKPWRDRIDDSSFRRAHLQCKSQKPFMVGFGGWKGVVDMAILDKDVGRHRLTAKEYLRMPCYYDRESFELAGSCHGILFIVKTLRKVTRLILWNPNIREIVKFDLPNFHDKVVHPNFHDKVVHYGFGYDSSRDVYKVVRLTRSNYHLLPDNEVQVLTVKSGEWRQVSYDLPYVVARSYSVVSLNGALHWCAFKDREETIVRFDLADETFSPLSLPAVEKGVVRGIFEREGKLGTAIRVWDSDSDSDSNFDSDSDFDSNADADSVSDSNYCHIDIWVMTDKSWVKLFSISERFFDIISRSLDINWWGDAYSVDDMELKTNEGLIWSVKTAWQSIVLCANSLISLV